MKYTSLVYAEARGSVGGLTYSRNGGGLYTRARAVPVQPNTVQQQLVKSYFAALSTAWAGLTAPQRADWETYAFNVPMVNSLGATIYLSGRSHFIRGNMPRLLASIARVDPGPADLSIPSFTPPTAVITASTDLMALSFTNTDAWAGEVGGAMLVFCSRPVPVTVTSFKGPYRYAGKVLGAATPPTSPASITLPFTVTVGQKIFWTTEIVRADGRLSAQFRNGGTAA